MTRRLFAAAALLFIGTGVVTAQLGGPLPLPEGTVIVREGGGRIQRSDDGGVSWEGVPGLPARVLPRDHAGEPLPVTALAVEHPGRENVAGRAALGLAASLKQDGVSVSFDGGLTLVAVGRRLFAGRDGLLSWQEIELDETVSRATYVTALAIDPGDPDHWLMGTSYDGLFRTQDGGETWTDLTADRSRWPFYQGAGFYDEVAEIWFSPEGDAYLQIGFGGGYLRVTLDPVTATRLGPSLDRPDSYAAVTAAVGTHLHRPAYPNALWDPSRAIAAVPPGTPEKPSGMPPESALEQTGIYLSAQNAAPDRLDAYFDLMDRFGYTKMVVDFKDDDGRVTYRSEVPLARRIGAVTPMIEPQELIDRAHARGFSVVARVVVFKDPKLFAWDGNRYAYWDRVRDIPWGRYRVIQDQEGGNQRTVNIEPWVDAYSEEVHQYVVDVAAEIEAMGIDEIQFDYIRFPSDGTVQNIVSRFKPDGADRVQALEAFLLHARRALSVPISIDVFGFNAWARMSYLGQDISRLSAYVDVISPMAYPSHYARAFLPQFSYLDRAFHIYRSGSYRAHRIAGAHTVIRPYVQAFLIGSELEFERPTFERYLELQVEGLEESPASGYTLWNASGRYYMLPR